MIPLIERLKATSPKAATRALLAYILLTLCALSVRADEVLVIDSYHASYPWTQECRQGLIQQLHPQHRVSYVELDTKRIPKAQFRKAANNAWLRYRDLSPDLVIIMDDNALNLLGERISQDGTPVVFMGINNNPRRYFSEAIPTNVTGVLERPSLKRSTYMIQRLIRPGLEKKLLLMMDAGPTSYAIIDTSLEGQTRARFGDSILRTYLTSNWEEWQRKIKRLKKEQYDALIIANYAAIKDRNGEQITLDHVSEWTSRHSEIPVFAFWGYSVGPGKALGGLIISGVDQGRNAAQIANEILDGVRYPKIRSPISGELTYSESELKRWSIALPDDLRQAATMVD